MDSSQQPSIAPFDLSAIAVRPRLRREPSAQNLATGLEFCHSRFDVLSRQRQTRGKTRNSQGPSGLHPAAHRNEWSVLRIDNRSAFGCDPKLAALTANHDYAAVFLQFIEK